MLKLIDAVIFELILASTATTLAVLAVIGPPSATLTAAMGAVDDAAGMSQPRSRKFSLALGDAAARWARVRLIPPG